MRTRREFVAGAAPLVFVRKAAAQARTRPNILWISCEDMSPTLGCYGDTYAHSPNLDKFAAQGQRYTHAFSVAGVCAPSRSGIITAMYPTSIGTHHMRSKGVPPSYVRCFTEYLREEGYYASNNVKTDYNFDVPLTAWDEVSNKAHWRGRAKGQPFFSVFNFTTTHESQIRADEQTLAAHRARFDAKYLHDPAKAPVPPYFPDTPVVRRDIANHYDTITSMDAQVGGVLRQLEEDGLAENTMVFFWSDHGWGMPRGKRWIYDSGVRVALMVRAPGVTRAGSVTNRLVSLIDLGPTAMSLAGIKPPEYMQGKAFLGPHEAPAADKLYFVRDRMDETYDMIRGVRDHRYKYLRNYQWQKPYAQFISYMDEMPTLKEWRRLHAAGKLVGPQRNFFAPEKPKEELYDTAKDPHEVVNLADSPEHRMVLERMRMAHERWTRETGDLGHIPEAELQERWRPGGKWSKTEKPVIRKEGGLARITCATEGASIGWTVEAGEKPAWKVYKDGVRVEAGKRLRARAVRLGFEESEEAAMEF